MRQPSSPLLVAVAAHAGLVETDSHAGEAPSEGPALLHWLEDAGPHLGLEIAPVEVPFSELATSLAHASPALITTPSGVLAVIGARRQRLVVLDPTLQRRELAISDVVSELAREATATATTTATATLANAQLSTASRDRAVAALVAAALKRSSVGGIVLVRRPPEATAGMHARDLRLAPRLVGLVALHVVSQLLWLGSWWAIGHAVLGGAGVLAGVRSERASRAQAVVSRSSTAVSFETPDHPGKEGRVSLDFHKKALDPRNSADLNARDVNAVQMIMENILDWEFHERHSGDTFTKPLIGRLMKTLKMNLDQACPSVKNRAVLENFEELDAHSWVGDIVNFRHTRNALSARIWMLKTETRIRWPSWKNSWSARWPFISVSMPNSPRDVSPCARWRKRWKSRAQVRERWGLARPDAPLS